MDLASIVRVVTLLAGLLVYAGINVPENVIEAISYVVFGIFTLYVAYKNNYLFKRGKKQKKFLESYELYEKNK